MLNFLLPFWRSKRRPRRVKERAAKLVRTGGTRNLAEVQAEVKAILAELVSKNLILENAIDHIDRGDAYRLLGDLRVLQMNFIDAEKKYRAAVDCYNVALKLEAGNQLAISNKFNTVESINELERTRF